MARPGKRKTERFLSERGARMMDDEKRAGCGEGWALLAANVVLRAVSDYLRTPLPPGTSGWLGTEHSFIDPWLPKKRKFVTKTDGYQRSWLVPQSIDVYESARAFFESNGSCLEFWCDIAGWDADSVRRETLEMKRGGRPMTEFLQRYGEGIE